MCTLTMELSTNRKQLTRVAGSVASNKSPAYSTLGSRAIRRVLQSVYDRVFACISQVPVFARVGDRTQVQKLVDATNRRRHRSSSPDALASFEPHATDHSMQESVVFLVSAIVSVLREVTHPDKLIVPKAVEECGSLMERLEKQMPSVATTLTHAFKTNHARVWDHVVDALAVMKHCFLDKGLPLFESHLRHLHQRKRVDTKDMDDAAVHPPSSSPMKCKASRKEKRSSGVHNTASFSGDNRFLLKTFRNVSSQL